MPKRRGRDGGDQSPWALLDPTVDHILNASAYKRLARHHKLQLLPGLPSDDQRWLKKGKPETETATYLRVSNCLVDASLISLKLAAAILALEGAAIVCPKINDFVGSVLVAEVGAGEGRRLDRGTTANAGVDNTKKEQAEMGCAATIFGVLTSFTAVSKFLAQAVMQCPISVDARRNSAAGCSMGIGKLTTAIFKLGLALSDVDEMCTDPERTNYSEPIPKDRKDAVMAACLVNIGQATAYLGKIGLSINGISTSCSPADATPNNGVRLNKWAQAACGAQVAGEFANIGQVARYIAGAASSCGNSVLIPFACANRVATAVTALVDVAQGAFTIIQFCTKEPWWMKMAKTTKKPTTSTAKPTTTTPTTTMAASASARVLG